jgi:hypothetical protein
MIERIGEIIKREETNKGPTTWDQKEATCSKGMPE